MEILELLREHLCILKVMHMNKVVVVQWIVFDCKCYGCGFDCNLGGVNSFNFLAFVINDYRDKLR